MSLRLLLLVLAILSGGAASQAEPQKLIWGVNGHPFTAYPGISFDDQLKVVSQLGMTSYRVNVSSIDSAPALRSLVDRARPLGIDILPVLTPPLDLKAHTPDYLYSRAKAFAAYYASRFKDDIRVWELGNELENFAIIQPCEMRDDGVQYNCDWGPAGGVGPLEYYGPRWKKVSAVLKGMSDAVKSIDPGIRKALGTAGWGHVGAFERMRQDGIEWDISVWHFYGDDIEWGLERVSSFGKPIWVTEFNHPLGSQKGEQQQAEGLEKIMKQINGLREKYNVEAAHIYELLDEPYWAPDFEAYMGLVRLEKDRATWKLGAHKPAFCSAKGLTLNVEMTHSHTCDLCKSGARPPSTDAKVEHSYCLVLGRLADGEGLKAWRKALGDGMEPAGLLVRLFQSAEAKEKYKTDGMDDVSFVHLVYRVFLRREPYEAGLSGYIDRLEKSEMSRFDIAKAVIASEEFVFSNRLLFSSPDEVRHVTRNVEPPAH